MDSETSLSKFISLILRHKPAVIGIKLNEHGWANVQELIDGINKTGREVDIALLDKIVVEDSKCRYSYNADHTMIRANQGHSVEVDVELKTATPPDILYHGTAESRLKSIMEQGLRPQSRLYVHLSDNVATAINVGARHGKATVLKVNAKDMANEGYVFYLSDNNVWLTREVPQKYLSAHQ